MALIKKLIETLKGHPKRIVFPEGSDPRILQAARKFASQEISVPILLGNRTEIKSIARQLDIKLDHIRIIDPKRSDEVDDLVDKLLTYPRFQDLSLDEARERVVNKGYFAALMLECGHVDAMVGGATTSASSNLRPVMQIIPRQEGVNTASSMMILDSDDDRHSYPDTLFMSDCAVIPEPTAEQLADIAVTTAALSYHLMDEKPKVAMLSYSTKSKSSKSPSVMKVKAATELAHRMADKLKIPMNIDGEIQADAAIDPAIAKQKKVFGSVAGHANVLIFPDLNSANISSKLIQILCGSRSFGQVITGLTKPVAEISRGASAQEIFGTAVITAVQAVDRHLLSPTSLK